ncbi:MAG TPA: transglycosylase SLT domain-containing protein [Oligoflexia bacterium]|mgnify:CR=1 FL=1|nr:transglycosylase SLT domain-containing protein [Oligoflexia bacterium]HMP26888.1 transglycosylase SLT domain-containing protein [Oligoflexia bacterium]
MAQLFKLSSCSAKEALFGATPKTLIPTILINRRLYIKGQASRFAYSLTSAGKTKIGAILLSSFAGLICFVALLIAGRLSALPAITAFRAQPELVPAIAEYNLAPRDIHQQREISSQIHYIGEIIGGFKKKLPKKDRIELASLIYLESIRSGEDPFFITAIIKSESSFNDKALSYAGAMGLMQIMPATGKYISNLSDLKWEGHTKLNDPGYNIRLGIYYLKHLKSYFESNLEHALVAYNLGPNKLFEILKRGGRLPSAPLAYARRIIKDSARWQTEWAANREQFQHLEIQDLKLAVAGLPQSPKS